MGQRKFLASAVFLLGFSTAGLAAAEPQAEALKLFEESADRYREGKFDDAAALLERAYALHPEPVLLYNLGRAYEGLGESEKAIDAYKRYLEGTPDAKDRGALERRIETLERQVAERQRLAEERRRLEEERKRRPAEPVPQPKPVASSGAGPWPWVVAGVGVASVGVGAIFGLQAQAKRDDAENELIQRRAAETFRNAETSASTANVFFIAGTVITGAGVTWIILDQRGKREQARLELRLAPGSIALAGRL
ncbi:MAG: tetratricopeptide repeat protein [Polyangiaceae bacterium]|nr:tetratricopeptide repeat protein [Polyangiaceae bacterium]